jgi:uncharacterized protein
MDVLKIKPEKELKALWYISWAILLIIFILITVGFMFVAQPWLIVATISIWILISIPIIIWIPAAFRVLEYQIDDEGVKMKGGVVWKKHVTVPYSKITNVDITQGPVQRWFNIGTIHVQTAGAGGQQGQKAELKMNGIRELERIRDIIVKEVKGLTYTKGGEVTKREKVTVSDSESVFEDILKELKEIKILLGKRQDN